MCILEHSSSLSLLGVSVFCVVSWSYSPGSKDGVLPFLFLLPGLLSDSLSLQNVIDGDLLEPQAVFLHWVLSEGGGGVERVYGWKGGREAGRER